MDISKIDKNFAVGEFRDYGEIRYYNIPCAPFDLYGVYYEKETERFVRMPSEIADRVNDGVKILNGHTAGGRIRFSTDSDIIAISVTYRELWEMDNMPLAGSAGFVLLEETDKGFKHIQTFKPRNITYDTAYKNHFELSAGLKGGKMRNYVMFMPIYNDVQILKIGLAKDANVAHGKPYLNVKPILYYGSSITQGGCASRSDNCYQAIISKRNNIDYINLGFSGSGKAEPIICEYLAGIDCSVFVCDYDHNAPDVDYLEKTHYALYKTFRDKQAKTPVVFISKPDIEHDTRWKKRRDIIKNTYLRAVREGDKNVYFIDGSKFFGKERHVCTVDGCHPNDVGFSKMAKKIGAVLDKIVSGKM